MTKERVLGCDISVNQGDVNFQKMKDAGAEFVIARKQIGYYGDVNFAKNLAGAKAVELPFGAYGVPYPGYDMTRQQNKFMENISPKDLDFPPFPDVEVKHKIAKSTAIGQVLQYMYALKQWWGESIPYTAKYVWEDFYSSAKGWIDDWELWVANYTGGGDNPKYIPMGWMYHKDGTVVAPEDSYILWQFSADGNGRGSEFGASSRDIDLDYMDKDFFDRYINPTPPQPPQPPQDTVTITLDIATATSLKDALAKAGV